MPDLIKSEIYTEESVRFVFSYDDETMKECTVCEGDIVKVLYTQKQSIGLFKTSVVTKEVIAKIDRIIVEGSKISLELNSSKEYESIVFTVRADNIMDIEHYSDEYDGYYGDGVLNMSLYMIDETKVDIIISSIMSYIKAVNPSADLVVLKSNPLIEYIKTSSSIEEINIIEAEKFSEVDDSTKYKFFFIDCEAINISYYDLEENEVNSVKYMISLYYNGLKEDNLIPVEPPVDDTEDPVEDEPGTEEPTDPPTEDTENPVEPPADDTEDPIDPPVGDTEGPDTEEPIDPPTEDTENPTEPPVDDTENPMENEPGTEEPPTDNTKDPTDPVEPPVVEDTESDGEVKEPITEEENSDDGSPIKE